MTVTSHTLKVSLVNASANLAAGRYGNGVVCLLSAFITAWQQPKPQQMLHTFVSSFHVRMPSHQDCDYSF